MPPTFRNPLRNLISSAFPMSVTELGSEVGRRTIPADNVATAIVIWVRLILALLRSNESGAVWDELTGYRVEKAYYCKNDTMNEHEFMIVDFSRSNQRDHIFLRLERSAGPRKDPQSSNPSSSSIGSYASESAKSSSLPPTPGFYEHKSSGSSSSAPSVKDGIAKVTGSLHQAVRRLSESSVSRPSAISSGRYMAADTVEKIDGLPKQTKVIKTIEFNSTDVATRPRLWDLAILAHVINQYSETYELFQKQCYWFADTISAILEKWSDVPGAVAIINGRPARSRFLKRNKSSGSVGILVVHRRKPDEIEQIWTRFQKQRDEFNKERYAYENHVAEEVRQLRKEQEERESQLRKEQEERESQLRKEQEERERDFQRQLQASNRQWEARLRQKEQETDRRLQQIEQMVRVFSGSETKLDTPRPLYPQSSS